MPLRHVALVSESDQLSISDLTRAAAALQKQATRDFGPLWKVRATVDAFGSLDDVPIGYWPVIVQEDIGTPGALGVHLDQNNQPFALVELTDNWQLTASHETMEMLADPFGNRVIAGDSPKPDQGRVEFLVEVCDPSEAAEFGYTVNGITVSDFYTPHYFDPVVAAGVRYSFTGAITEPRQVLRGGYLSWHDPASDHWFQEVFFGDTPQFRDLGQLSQRAGSLREQIDRLTSEASLKAMRAGVSRLTAGLPTAAQMSRASESRARLLRAQIEQLIAGGKESTAGEPEGRSRRRPTRQGGASTRSAGTQGAEPLQMRRPPRRGETQD